MKGFIRNIEKRLRCITCPLNSKSKVKGIWPCGNSQCLNEKEK